MVMMDRAMMMFRVERFIFAIIYMLYNIYSKKYGWLPLRYLLMKQKNFYTAREKWLIAHRKGKKINS